MNKQAKVTSFPPHASLHCRGRLLDLSIPAVVGILNVTPDSFYDGGKHGSEDAILRKVRELTGGGAAVIDIGGASSRPGAAAVTEREEERRLLPAVELVSSHFPEAVLSVDTFRSAVAGKAVAAGAHIINDVTGGTYDGNMYATAAALGTPYVLMHRQGSPENMQDDPRYGNVTAEVAEFFSERLDLLRAAGVNDVILDPGFGFGKTAAHNLELLRNLSYFSVFGLPVMTGISRKSTIYKLLGVSPQEALNGSTVLHTIALLNGASLLRVHDAREAAEAVKLVTAYIGQE